MTTTLHSPNDHLRVTNKGMYKIIEVCDKCPLIPDDTDILAGR